MAYKEYSLSTNSFKRPKVFTGNQAIGLLLVRLILLEPGTDPIRPEMGLGLVSKYRFMTEDALSDLRTELNRQIDDYLPGLQTTNIDFDINPDKTLIIKIIASDTEYILDTNEIGTPITIKDFIN